MTEKVIYGMLLSVWHAYWTVGDDRKGDLWDAVGLSRASFLQLQHWTYTQAHRNGFPMWAMSRNSGTSSMRQKPAKFFSCAHCRTAIGRNSRIVALLLCGFLRKTEVSFTSRSKHFWIRTSILCDLRKHTNTQTDKIKSRGSSRGLCPLSVISSKYCWSPSCARIHLQIAQTTCFLMLSLDLLLMSAVVHTEGHCRRLKSFTALFCSFLRQSLKFPSTTGTLKQPVHLLTVVL